MIHMTLKMRAQLYLAMTQALDVTDDPQTPEEAQRLALCELVADYSGGDGPYALHEAFRLADAMDYYLTEHAEAGPHGFSVANVARLVGGDRDTAKAALRLLGARPTYDPEGPDDWSTGPRQRDDSIRFPRDLLAEYIRLELEEAEGFAA
ncbi:hypothetical protein Ga0609869_000030 [Rhodovulum iodosum]|uniref:Uncharacterized protein n=1 Tax=Rhodovulum iodosum TaxID=68291 RepID=A0ABV3XMZ5_9RHOB|nr:hypothetical protein [Rhodovulum robiginosum]RSK35820.1 hypothetical protein EJA01_05580 [Rhodovulum robiginosum]